MCERPVSSRGAVINTYPRRPATRDVRRQVEQSIARGVFSLRNAEDQRIDFRVNQITGFILPQIPCNGEIWSRRHRRTLHRLRVFRCPLPAVLLHRGVDCGLAEHILDQGRRNRHGARGAVVDSDDAHDDLFELNLFPRFQQDRRTRQQAEGRPVELDVDLQ